MFGSELLYAEPTTYSCMGFALYWQYPIQVQLQRRLEVLEQQLEVVESQAAPDCEVDLNHCQKIIAFCSAWWCPDEAIVLFITVCIAIIECIPELETVCDLIFCKKEGV